MASRFALATLALLLVALLPGGPAASAAPPAQKGGLQAAWVQFGPDGPTIRAITDDIACPSLNVDGATPAMAVRARSDGASFPVLTCEAPLPSWARQPLIDGRRLPVPELTPRRILVI